MQHKISYSKVIYLLIILGCAIHLAGQEIEVRGLVLDADSGEAIEYASIAFYSSADSSLQAGSISDESGHFSIAVASSNPMYYMVQFMGYKTHYSSVQTFTRNTDVGIFRLSINASTLSEITVTGREVSTQHRLDKQVFDGKQFMNAQGGNATDLLSNLPSIAISANGELTVRGVSGFTLMVDGKPIQADPAVLLNQLPANAIDDIEIVTAPSAKYDPDGKAGIINIKTKKGKVDGVFLVANTQVGLPSIEDYDNAEKASRYGADLTFNYVKDRWDLSLGLDYKRDDVSGRRVGYVNTYRNDVLTEFPSYGERSFDRESYTGRITLAYHPTRDQTISTAFYAGKRSQFRTADILYDYQRRARLTPNQFRNPTAYWDDYDLRGRVSTSGIGIDSLQYFNTNLRVRRGDFLLGQIGYDLNLGNDYKLEMSALYERTILGGPTDNSNLNYPNITDTLQFQFNDNDNPLDGIRLQVDLTKEFGDHSWQSGYQFRHLKHPGDFVYLDRNLFTNEWVVNPTFTNRIDLRRSIHSIYSQLSGTLGKLAYTAGLRLEAFDRKVTLATPDSTYRLQQFNPFPSVNLLYPISESLSLKAAYSRRIARTTTFKMTPFPEREHSETLEQGDAELKPEFVDLVEVGLVNSWKDNQFYATGYWRNTADVVNRVNTIYNDSILNRIYTNAGQATAFGFEAGLTLYPLKWCRLFMGVNIFNYRIKGNLFGEKINTSSTMYSHNSNVRFTISPTVKANVALNYLSRRITAQGEDSRFYNPSFTLTKSFLDDQLQVNLQWLNIDMGLLNSNEQRITTVRSNFYTTTNYIYEVDVIILGVTYHLNNPSKQSKLLKSEFGDKEF